MTIDEFLKNAGNKGAIIPGRDLLITNLNYRLSLILKNQKIDMNIYTHKKDVYYHFIIPSENKERDCTYDIILKFKYSKKSDEYDGSYRRYELEFFSNCPSFTYGYAYVANINGYLIKDLSVKYDEKVLKYPPVSKNPGLVFGYEKSIYFSCRYLMDNRNFLTKTYVDSYAKPLTPQILKSIRHMNVIEEQYARADKVMREQKKKNKVKVDKKTQKRKEEYINKSSSSNKNNVNVIKKTKAKKPSANKIQPIKKKK